MSPRMSPRMSRNTFTEQALTPMESDKTGRHDSLQHSPKHTFKERSTKAKTVSKRNVKSRTKKHGGTGEEETSADEGDNADEEGCSAEQDDDDEVEEPEVLAPSDRSNSADNALTTRAAKLRRTGRVHGSETANANKKRSFYVTKNKSLLSEKDEANDATAAAYPRKKAPRRLSNNHGFLTYDTTSDKVLAAAIDLSDDDGYAAVDDISDSDDNANGMEKLEEQAIVDSELEESTNPHREGDSDFGEMDFSMDLSTMGANSFFADQMDQQPEHQTFFLLDPASPSPQPSPTTRKVHFADAVSEGPSSSETSSDTAELPDIFLDSAMNMSMVHNTPRQDEYESFNSYPNSEDGSYWDWRDEDANQSTPMLRGFQGMTVDFAPLPIEADDGDESGASSGYDCMTVMPSLLV